jgi:hypothetical protein
VIPNPSTHSQGLNHHDEQGGARPTSPTPAGSAVAVPAQVQWHLTETISALRSQPPPLDPALLVVVLRGMAELCRLLHSRGHEAGARPPVLFRDNPVIAEALGMWATEVGCLAREWQAASQEWSRP